MFEPNDRYTGQPNVFQKSFRVVLLFLVVGLCLWMCHYYYTEFTAFESGKDIKIDNISYLIYTIGGKWLNIGIFFILGLVLGYREVKQMQADYSIEDTEKN